jgi:hypothetical protein
VYRGVAKVVLFALSREHIFDSIPAAILTKIFHTNFFAKAPSTYFKRVGGILSAHQTPQKKKDG